MTFRTPYDDAGRLRGDVLRRPALRRARSAAPTCPAATTRRCCAACATKVLPLADDIVVLPGHGEQTSIGRERATNPFLLDLLDDGAAGRVTRGL